MDDRELRPDGLLYHYTSTEGFLGIMGSGNIHATNIRYLNDSEEFLDAINHLDGYLEEFEPSERPKIEKFAKSTLRLFSDSIFVASFTDDSAALRNGGNIQTPGDRLNQWRTYCGNGGGFSLGFDPIIIDRQGLGLPLENLGVMTYLHDCIYDPGRKRSILQSAGKMFADDLWQYIVEPALRKMGDWPDDVSTIMEPEDAHFQEVLQWWKSRQTSAETETGKPLSEPDERIKMARFKAMLGLVLYASSFKNGAFFEEREWRIVINPKWRTTNLDVEDHQPDWPTKFRKGPFGITPYIEFPLDLTSEQSPLKRIVIGPTPHMEESIRATNAFLAQAGIKIKSDENGSGVEVRPSNIPYRYW